MLHAYTELTKLDCSPAKSKTFADRATCCCRLLSGQVDGCDRKQCFISKASFTL
jgi:hypothetical protein